MVHPQANQILASNDDCPGAQLSSCVTFSPSTTDYYVVRVKPYPGSSVGPLQQYDIRLEKDPDDYNADDYGDDLAGASPLRTDGVFVDGFFYDDSDDDVFRWSPEAARL